MKIMVAGDVHGDIDNIQYLIDVAKSNNASHIYVCGDFGIFNRLEKYCNFESSVIRLTSENNIHISFIKGNHEDHNYLDEISKGSTDIIDISEYLHYLPNRCVWDIDGIKFGAMGGAHSIDVFTNSRIDGVDWFRNETISNFDVAYASDMGIIDVLLSHDQPISGDIYNYTQYPMHPETVENRTKLQKVCDTVMPKLLIHGHYHLRKDFIGKYKIRDFEYIEFPIISLNCNFHNTSQFIIFDTITWKNTR